jgi:hypothetical protein
MGTYVAEDGTEHPAIHTSLSMTCPEVIRKGILEPTEPITFAPYDIERDKVPNGEGKLLSLYPGLSVEPLVAYAVEIQQLCIDVMQCRTATVADRLFVIGMLLDKISNAADVATGFDGAMKCAMALVNGDFNNITESFPANEAIDSAMKALIIGTSNNFLKSEVFSTLCKTLDNRNKENSDEQRNLSVVSINEYSEEWAKEHWGAFLESRSIVLENYFVNYMFVRQFPFSHLGKMSVYQHFILLAEQYALFRMFFSAFAANSEDGKVTDTQINEVMVATYKSHGHSKNLGQLKKQYIEAGLDSLAHMAFLLRK